MCTDTVHVRTHREAGDFQAGWNEGCRQLQLLDKTTPSDTDWHKGSCELCAHCLNIRADGVSTKCVRRTWIVRSSERSIKRRQRNLLGKAASFKTSNASFNPIKNTHTASSPDGVLACFVFLDGRENSSQKTTSIFKNRRSKAWHSHRPAKPSLRISCPFTDMSSSPLRRYFSRVDKVSGTLFGCGTAHTAKQKGGPHSRRVVARLSRQTNTLRTQAGIQHAN